MDFYNSIDTALNVQNRKLPCKRPEKLYATYLENRYKLFVGTPKWAKLEKKSEADLDNLNNDILKVYFFNILKYFLSSIDCILLLFPIFSIVAIWKYQK